MEKEMTKNQITKFQLFFLLIQSQIGVALLSLPHAVEKSANGDGWISTIIAGVAVQVMLIVYWQLLKRFPALVYTEITKKVVGRFLGKFLNIFIYMNFILVGGLATILFIKLINLWLLPLTPGWIISALILTACMYLAVSDIKIIARFYVLATSLILLLWFTSVLSWFTPKDYQYVLPIGSSGMKNILLGSNNSLLAMLGFEALLFFFPFVIDNKKGVLKTVSMANLFITLFYTYFIFITLITFSTDQLMQMREPILNLLRGISYNMIDRVDLIFLSVWMVPMATSIITYLFAASKSLNLGKKNYSKAVVLNGCILFLITLIPNDDAIITLFNQYVSYLSYVVVFLIPTLLLILSLLMKKHEMSESR
ncbi:GerAB/ArcD/ProY family transporter [Neobacillus sp. 179-C4.2 HS]|uniref:GerAB/ArcD/ProY family transporter n=1 Tax=Neobacillus driksii TaxID=3035913 RepID=A0ABV4Z0B6_9BACI|nr:GerAB/ArcD/ProY family transporter [Neobacillus sp. 179.-C4.2 HS]MDP5197374.1 GerAB/ArcD/ProY family transporter [Neobacillus sp. 179.-C4.2 HS]